ncbi:hypothetical protein N7481_007268 [Penicillium waksmanii]|uniref:uncharacterized protein n=1 Tax=Penicillium waksmanii TaxID=69791 RepID=UPI0025496E94|nr:uncharacterized protein N7481_007268 [Penicillium waksmanii]KAJ5979970.1 hypothetical protein N7481_007268 [Penicillium waksmanii]
MLDDQPRRSRRSSISEHIQRVFNVDRLDKKRVSDGFQADQARNAALVPKSEITIGFEVGAGSTIAGETKPSSFTHSSRNSRLPSVSTPGSSPPVHPVRVQDEDAEDPKQLASDMSAPNANTNTTNNASAANIDLICRSPTWEKDVNRKERRATKRLEAERKELEKRLSHLEEAQLKLDQGVYDRNSRRLTKKQPLGSSTRSSSANTERPRSSSFTSLFSSKRRSRSRASSMTGSDRESRSSIENGPPTLPLTLPEQFGTAVSRELATRHGTSLVPSHQMPRALHHTPAKSDDLRENWKLAEEWKKKTGGTEPENTVTTKRASFRSKFTRSDKHTPNGSSTSYPPSKPMSTPHPTPHTPSQATELSADLDRDSFTAALRAERIAPGVASRNPNASSPNAASTTGNFPKKGRADISQKTYKSSPLALNPFTNKDDDQKHGRSPKSATQPAGHGHGHGNTTPSRLPEEQGQGQRGQGRLNANGFKKSSPPTRPVADHSVTAKMQAPVTSQQQRPANEKSTENRPARMVSPDTKAEHMPRDANMSPLMVPPLKHSGRRSTIITSGSPKSNNGTQEAPIVVAETQEVSVPASTPALDQVNSKTDSTRRVYQLTDGGPGNTSMQSVHRPGHSRTSSHSSYGGSSYDTADEEVLDISKAHTKMKPQPSPPQASPSEAPQGPPPRAQAQASKFQAPKSPNTNPPMAMQLQDAGTNGMINPNVHFPIPRANPNPPLAPDGPIAMMRSTLVQRTKKPLKDQVLAKLFVICCSCKYWHDMPSEIYARLACPERLPSESRLVRTFSRKISSRRNSIFSSSDPSGRGLPSQLRVQPPSNKGTGGGTENGSPEQRNGNGNGASALVPVQCNWCGHGMTRACCQGWTTLVQMRDRHH